jgi:hypothetical protein
MGQACCHGWRDRDGGTHALSLNFIDRDNIWPKYVSLSFFPEIASSRLNSRVIPALSRYVGPRDPVGAGWRGPTYRLGGRNDDSFGVK